MKDQFLDLDVRLLVVRHGKRRVLEAIASMSNQSIEGLEDEIRQLEERKKRSGRGVRTATELVDAACQGRLEVHPAVSTLVGRYENRTFLPQLRQVERFLDQAGVKHGKLKSRSAALPKVVQALASLSPAQLEQFTEEGMISGVSEFSLLANEIMGLRDERRK